jgi:hypothetical protein
LGIRFSLANGKEGSQANIHKSLSYSRSRNLSFGHAFQRSLIIEYMLTPSEGLHPMARGP